MSANGTAPTNSDSWYSENATQTAERLHRIRTEPPPTADIGRGLIYPGQITTCFGEPDAGKSLLAAAIGAEEANNGISTLWIDFEQGADRTLRRLTEFGATDHTLTTSLDRIHYPMGAPPTELFHAFEGIQLVIVDALTGLLTAMGLSSNSDTDIETAYALVLRPFAKLGAGVFVIDHVNKDKENQGRWATGSQRKISAADVALKFVSIQRFKPGYGGKARITVSRDRDGAVQHSVFSLEPNMTWTVEGNTVQGEFRPSVLMERISQYLESQTTGVSGRTIEDDVEGNRKFKRDALKLLVNENYVTTQEGKQRSILHLSNKPYRASEDPQCASAPECAKSALGALQKSSAPVRHPYEVGKALSARTLNTPSALDSAPEYPLPDEAYDSLTDPTSYYDEITPHDAPTKAAES